MGANTYILLLRMLQNVGLVNTIDKGLSVDKSFYNDYNINSIYSLQPPQVRKTCILHRYKRITDKKYHSICIQSRSIS